MEDLSGFQFSIEPNLFLLMDLQMPVMDGYTATKKIREFNQIIPIIALTASAEIDIKLKSKNIGLNDFLTKPFNPVTLNQVLKGYKNRTTEVSESV